MNRRLAGAGLVPLAALALTAGATAQPSNVRHSAKTFHGTFYPARDADTYAYPGVNGHVQLVDGKKNDKLSLHVAGLQPKTAYTYSLNGSTNAHPCSPTAASNPVSGFNASYPATSNADGVANARARSHTFTAVDTTTYYVVFKQGPNVLACAVLHGKKPHHSHHHSAPTRPQHPSKTPVKPVKPVKPTKPVKHS
jgi:hypothetical protein